MCSAVTRSQHELPCEMAMTYGMGAGYAKHARLQGAAADALVPAFTEAVDRAVAGLDTSRDALCVTEIGPADGAATGKFVSALLSRIKGVSIKNVVFTLVDVPANGEGGHAGACTQRPSQALTRCPHSPLLLHRLEHARADVAGLGARREGGRCPPFLPPRAWQHVRGVRAAWQPGRHLRGHNVSLVRDGRAGVCPLSSPRCHVPPYPRALRVKGRFGGRRQGGRRRAQRHAVVQCAALCGEG